MMKFKAMLQRILLVTTCCGVVFIYGCARDDNRSGDTGGNTGDNTGTYGDDRDRTGTTGTGTGTGTTGDRTGTGTGEIGTDDQTGTTRRGGEGDEDMSTGAAGSASDNQLTTRVRQAIQQDNTLGMDAGNIRVTVENGTVTLRGPVSSEQVKDNIEEKVKKIAGVRNVDNQLQVTNEGR